MVAGNMDIAAVGTPEVAGCRSEVVIDLHPADLAMFFADARPRKSTAAASPHVR